MRSSDWSSDVCSSDLGARGDTGVARGAFALRPRGRREDEGGNRQREQHRGKGGKSRARGKTGGKCHPRPIAALLPSVRRHPQYPFSPTRALITPRAELHHPESQHRSEEHTSELPSLMRLSYAVFSLKKTKTINIERTTVRS